MLANHCTVLPSGCGAVLIEAEEFRLGGSRCAEALAFMTWGVATTDEKGEGER
jgi:hypothetical protein